MTMRILFVTNRWPSPDRPGDSPAIREQAEAIRRAGHSVNVLVINSQSNRLSYLSAAWRVLRDVGLRRSYDIVHAHYGSFVGWTGRLQWRCPLVVTFRGSDLMRKSEYRVSRRLSRRVDAAIVMTSEMLDLLDGLDASVIPYGIDLSVFKPGDRSHSRQQLGLPADAPLLLFPYHPGRPMKRYDLVLAATRILSAEFPDLEVVSIHDEPSAHVAHYMAACDVMVMASDREGAPVALREALACQLPIVSVDVGDASELLTNVDMCFLADRDPVDIADKIATVLRSRRRIEEYPGVERFDAASAAQAVVGVYQSLLGTRSGAATGPDEQTERRATGRGGSGAPMQAVVGALHMGSVGQPKPSINLGGPSL